MSNVKIQHNCKFKLKDIVLCIKAPTNSGATCEIKIGDKAILEKCPQRDSSLTISEFRWRVYRKNSNKKTKKTYCYWKQDDDCFIDFGGSRIENQIKLELQRLGGVV